MARHIATVADISDLHCGGATALMPPIWRNADGLEIRQNRAQAWLWERWMDLAGRLKREASSVPVIAVFNGDIVEGRHHETPQLVSVEADDHADIAHEVVDMVAAQCKRLLFVAGTDAHVGHQGRTENIVAKTFASEGKDVIRPGEGALWVWPVALANIAGVEFNIAHHGRGSGLERNRNNGASAEAADQAIEAMFNGLPTPRYVLRGHTHRFAHGHYTRTNTTALTSGCWQLSTSHGHRIRPHNPPDIGCWLIRIYDDGATQHEQVQYEVIADHRNIVRIDLNGTTKTTARTAPRSDANRVAGIAKQRTASRGGRSRASANDARIRSSAAGERGSSKARNKNVN